MANRSASPSPTTRKADRSFPARRSRPFFCATNVFLPATATTPAPNFSGLATAAAGAQCNIAAEYKLYYRTTTAGCSFALPDPTPGVGVTATTAPAPVDPTGQRVLQAL